MHDIIGYTIGYRSFIEGKKISPWNIETQPGGSTGTRIQELLLAFFARLLEPKERDRRLLEDDLVDFLGPRLGDLDALLPLRRGDRRDHEAFLLRRVSQERVLLAQQLRHHAPPRASAASSQRRSTAASGA